MLPCDGMGQFVCPQGKPGGVAAVFSSFAFPAVAIFRFHSYIQAKSKLDYANGGYHNETRITVQQRDHEISGTDR